MAKKVLYMLVLVALTTTVVMFVVTLYGSHVIDKKQSAAAKECLSNGGVPLVAHPYTYCMDPKSMVGFPDVRPK